MSAIILTNSDAYMKNTSEINVKQVNNIANMFQMGLKNCKHSQMFANKNRLRNVSNI